MGTLRADVRFALRMMRGNPGFTAVAVAALALGIGASTAIFTVINAVLLAPLPYPQADRIMQIGRQFGSPDNYTWSNSVPKYMFWRNNRSFQDLAIFAMAGQGMNLGSGDRPIQVKALTASQEYLRVFGVSPVLGRGFTAEEDVPNGPKVAVIGNNLWQNYLGGDPGIAGKPILLNGEPYTVLGVLPKGFQPDPPADLILPQQADPNSTNQGNYLRVAGRLKPGVTVGAAQAEMKIVGQRFAAAFPKWMGTNESVSVVPLRDATVREVRGSLLILVGAVGFVLLIACANVANLLLARAAGRARELAVRTAIGAARWRVVRQLLTESVLLAGAGGLLGFVLGAWGVRGLLLLAPGNIPRLTDPDGANAVLPLLDWRVAGFSIAVALLTGILFGLYPALRTSNPDLASMLKEGGGRSGSSRKHNRTRSVLVVSEIALALVLLVGATLLIRTFVELRSVRPGFDSSNLLTLETSLAGKSYASTARTDQLVTQALRRIEGLPGVEAATTAIRLPVTGGVDLPFTISAKPPQKGQYNGDEQWRSVSAHYFQTFRIPVLRGRAFRETDAGNSARVVMINQAMAKKYWKDEDPIGQAIVIAKGLGPQFDDPPREIVGIAGNTREVGLDEGEVGVMYVPEGQVPEGMTALANSALPLTWAIRTAADPMNLRAAVEREIRAVDNAIPIAHMRTMDDVVSASVARQNFNMMLLGIFAGIALLLAAIGVYGLMAYSVEQRTQEIGIRMALGAGRGDMLGMVLLQGMKLAAAGLVLGLGISYGVTVLLERLLFGVKPRDPVTFAIVAGVLAVVALLATLLPARHAASIPPSEALRYS